MKKTILLMSLILLLSIGVVNATNQNDTNENISTTVTITNSAPTFTSVSMDDSDTSDSGAYIDLTPNATSAVTCTAVINDADGDADLASAAANATFYNDTKGVDGAVDNSFRYFDSSCSINTGYGGDGDAEITCTADFYWYADNGSWSCQVSVVDDAGNEVNGTTSSTSTVRELYALDIDSSSAINFGSLAIGEDTGTSDQTVSVYNVGNTIFDLILEPYASTDNDGASMSCTGGTLADSDLKYSLNSGTAYASKTSLVSGASPITESAFDLDRQTSGTTESSSKDVYFGFGIQSSETGVSGTCTGTLMFTATINA